MKSFRKLLALGAAAVAMAGVATSANAATAVVGSANTYISSSTAPGAQVFTTGVAVSQNSNLVNGNSVTFTLSTGTFAATPTITAYGNADCSTGGPVAGATITNSPNGTNNAVVALTAAVSCIVLGNLNVTGVGSAANSATVKVTVTESGGSLTSSNTATIASFGDLYTSVGAATPATPVSALVDYNNGTASQRGKRFFDNATSSGGVASLGTVTITRNSVKRWDNGTVGAPSAGTLTVTAPWVPAFGSLTGTGKGVITMTLGGGSDASCGVTGNASSVSGNTATFATAQGGLPAAGACTYQISGTLPSSPGFIAEGNSSITATSLIADTTLAGVNATNTQTADLGRLTVDTTGINITDWSYAVGGDAFFSTYINVAVHDLTANNDRVAVVAFGDGVAYGGDLGAVAANTVTLFTPAQVTAALQAAGAPTTLLQNSGKRASFRIIHPANSQAEVFFLNGQNNIATQIGHAASLPNSP